MDAFAGGMALLLDPYMLWIILAGTVLGVIVGALPGLSGSTTAALLLPITVTMTPVASIAFLGAIYCAANFGGSITAILINTPGDPSASATAYDGYPMAAKGEAAQGARHVDRRECFRRHLQHHRDDRRRADARARRL